MITPNQFAKQMIEFQKTSFISCYDAASTMQAKAGSALDRMLDQTVWIPSESHKIITDWLDTCEKERNRFKAYVEKSYANLGMYFAKDTVAKADKTGTPSRKRIKPSATAASEKQPSAAAELEKKPPTAPVKAAAPAAPPKTTASGTKPMKSAAAKKTTAVKKDSKAVLK